MYIYMMGKLWVKTDAGDSGVNFKSSISTNATQGTPTFISDEVLQDEFLNIFFALLAGGTLFPKI